MEKEIYINIGKNIKKYRKKKKYSLEKFSQITNIQIEKLKEYETKGVNENTTFYELNIICITLEIKLIELLNK